MERVSPVEQLCIEGTRAELPGRIDEARPVFLELWRASRDDYDTRVAAPYVARY